MSMQTSEQTNKILCESRRNQLAYNILHETASGISDTKYSNNNIIVSLTSYGRRLQDVAFAIESIMQQTMKANRIILWLAHEDYKHIPQSLILLQKRGLEIEECDDILSYKKIIPTLLKFPQDTIITIDDDAFYDYDVLERLITAYQKSPQYIYCCRAHKMKIANDGTLKPYMEWDWVVSEEGPDVLNFFTGCGGVLYPPHSLDEEVLNESVFAEICKFADDVWLNAMALKKGTRVSKVVTRKLSGEDFLSNDIIQDMALNKINTLGNVLNDSQIKTVFNKYSLYNKLKEK